MTKSAVLNLTQENMVVKTNTTTRVNLILFISEFSFKINEIQITNYC